MGIATQWRIAMCGALLAFAVSLPAHDSPEHEIEALTAKMAASGHSPKLLARRAAEWRALGKFKEASEDLRQAVSLKPDSVSILTELARVESAQDRHEEALATVEKALNLQSVEAEPLYLLRAEIW